jgi:hypothetical protein
MDEAGDGELRRFTEMYLDYSVLSCHNTVLIYIIAWSSGHKSVISALDGCKRARGHGIKCETLAGLLASRTGRNMRRVT